MGLKTVFAVIFLELMWRKRQKKLKENPFRMSFIHIPTFCVI